MSRPRGRSSVSITEPAVDAMLVVAKSTRQRVVIQGIRYFPTTYVAGTILNFIDSLTLQIIGQLIILPNVTQFSLDYGDSGTSLTLGAHLKLAVIAGGVTGRMIIDTTQAPIYVS